MPTVYRDTPATPTTPGGADAEYLERRAAKNRARTRARLIIAAIVTGALVLVFALFASLVGFTKADGGHVIVVRNGGLFDDNSIRQVIQPNSGLIYTGWWSSDHQYPTSQRVYKVSSSQDADSNEVINVPTRDGVLVGVEGSFYFQLTTDDTALRAFDDKFGTRTFPFVNADKETEQKAAWDGDEGWGAFLNFTLGNHVQNAFRQEISQVLCRDLVSSCALAQSSTGGAGSTGSTGGVNLTEAPSSATTLTAIQTKVQETFTRDVNHIIGAGVLVNVQFTLSKVTLPQNIQEKINETQASFAGIAAADAKAQADLKAAEGAKKVAETDALTNQIKQQGYANCPVCAQIDLTRSLPQGLTTYVAPGANTNTPVAVGGGGR